MGAVFQYLLHCRCYKLGKKRWSYNQCALVIQNAASGESTEVVDCMQYGPNPLTHDEQVPPSPQSHAVLPPTKPLKVGGGGGSIVSIYQAITERRT